MSLAPAADTCSDSRPRRGAFDRREVRNYITHLARRQKFNVLNIERIMNHLDLTESQIESLGFPMRRLAGTTWIMLTARREADRRDLKQEDRVGS